MQDRAELTHAPPASPCRQPDSKEPRTFRVGAVGGSTEAAKPSPGARTNGVWKRGRKQTGNVDKDRIAKQNGTREDTRK